MGSIAHSATHSVPRGWGANGGYAYAGDQPCVMRRAVSPGAYRVELTGVHGLGDVRAARGEFRAITIIVPLSSQ